MQLFSTDGSHVANVSPDGNGELFDQSFDFRIWKHSMQALPLPGESDSVAYEAQTGGDGVGDYNPDNSYDYEEDGVGRLHSRRRLCRRKRSRTTPITGMTVKEMLCISMGTRICTWVPDDVFHIDDAGRLCEY